MNTIMKCNPKIHNYLIFNKSDCDPMTHTLHIDCVVREPAMCWTLVQHMAGSLYHSLVMSSRQGFAI